jgi:hypothetical protein
MGSTGVQAYTGISNLILMNKFIVEYRVCSICISRSIRSVCRVWTNEFMKYGLVTLLDMNW